jgi:hypothetical protein
MIGSDTLDPAALEGEAGTRAASADAADDDGARLVMVASYYAPHDAELARSRLVAEGIRAFVWDATTVGVDPFLAVALRGVKVAVAQRDAGRARALLAPEPEAFEAMPRPFFRVRSSRGLRGLVVGVTIGLAVGAALARLEVDSIAVVAGMLVAVIGSVVGARLRADFCSACGAGLAPEETRCERCALPLSGTIRHRDERLAAEEALAPEPAAEPLPDAAAR